MLKLAFCVPVPGERMCWLVTDQSLIVPTVDQHVFDCTCTTLPLVATSTTSLFMVANQRLQYCQHHVLKTFVSNIPRNYGDV